MITCDRAKEILRLGSKVADYNRHMTNTEQDYVNDNIWNLYCSQNDVLKKISRGTRLPKEARS